LFWKLQTGLENDGNNFALCKGWIRLYCSLPFPITEFAAEVFFRETEYVEIGCVLFCIHLPEAGDACFETFNVDKHVSPGGFSVREQVAPKPTHAARESSLQRPLALFVAQRESQDRKVVRGVFL
jgi:hypothetical protein